MAGRTRRARITVGCLPTEIFGKFPKKSLASVPNSGHIARMKPLYFIWNVKYRNRSATRPFRMPAIIGVLLCAAGLRAISRKIFFRGPAMHRRIGNIYLRPLVGAFSAIVAAILLYACNHADAQSPPPMLGIMYLTNNDAVGDPIHDWSREPA